jgi:hypothetical protein
MRQPLLAWWLAAALAGGFSTGCGPARKPYLDDPFLASRPPVEGKLVEKEPVRVAFAEPVPPAASPIALAALPTRPPRPLLEDVPLQADTLAEKGPTHRPPPAVTALTVVRRKPATPYGHASDYSWLQGVLGRRADGELELHYADPPAGDPHGGKVVLIEGPCLDVFQPGEVLWVAGELAPPSERPVGSAGHPAPRYRVRSVCPVHPAQVPAPLRSEL